MERRTVRGYLPDRTTSTPVKVGVVTDVVLSQAICELERKESRYCVREKAERGQALDRLAVACLLGPLQMWAGTMIGASRPRPRICHEGIHGPVALLLVILVVYGRARIILIATGDLDGLSILATDRHNYPRPIPIMSSHPPQDGRLGQVHGQFDDGLFV